jgi:hypothetical protein
VNSGRIEVVGLDSAESEVIIITIRVSILNGIGLYYMDRDNNIVYIICQYGYLWKENVTNNQYCCRNQNRDYYSHKKCVQPYLGLIHEFN